MKNIRIADTTLCNENNNFSFKEKLEIARQLERLCVDVIELPEIINERTDILFVRTVASFVKKSVINPENHHWNQQNYSDEICNTGICAGL